MASLEQKLESVEQDKNKLEYINERRLLQVGSSLLRTLVSVRPVARCSTGLLTYILCAVSLLVTCSLQILAFCHSNDVLCATQHKEVETQFD